MSVLSRIRRLFGFRETLPRPERVGEGQGVPITTDPTNPLDVLCRRYAGTYERSRHADGRVFLVFKFGEGGLDQIAVAAPSTAEAIQLLTERLAKWTA